MPSLYGQRNETAKRLDHVFLDVLGSPSFILGESNKPRTRNLSFVSRGCPSCMSEATSDTFENILMVHYPAVTSAIVMATASTAQHTVLHVSVPSFLFVV